jgi:hypothetical protein
MKVENFDQSTDRYFCSWVVNSRSVQDWIPGQSLRQLSNKEANPHWYA